MMRAEVKWKRRMFEASDGNADVELPTPSAPYALKMNPAKDFS
jgi:hypothetical protein